jgi:hypothetical protein
MTIQEINEEQGLKREGKSPRKTITFLFGAGISKAAELPLSLELTNSVLTGLNEETHSSIFRHPNGRYLFEKPASDKMPGYLERVILLLKLLKTEADSYYFDDRAANYEDLYFMAEQVLDSLTFRRSNPIASCYAKHLQCLVGHLLKDTYVAAIDQRDFRPKRKVPCPPSISTMVELLRECCNYIRDVVCAMLKRTPETLNYFQWLIDAVADVNSGQKVFFTLNNDTLLEQSFKSANVKLVDGFGPVVESEGISYFDQRLFEDLSSPQLIKLHGSLDWFWTKSSPLQLFKLVERNRAAKRFELDNPLILVGTHNKANYYSAPLLAELHAHFRGVLKVSLRVIVCGYSFGDDAINTQLFYWLDQSTDNRVLVVHPDCADCKYGASSMSEHFVNQFENKKQVEFLRNKMECANWSEAKEKLLS